MPFEDAVPLLTAAMSAMAPGEVVKTDNLGYLDLMNAIQIMDPRMDSYTARMEAAGQEAEPILPAFDPTLELMPEELLWIFDELLRLEMAWLDGHPLVTTLFTCQYLRPSALAAMSSSMRGAGHDKERRPEYRYVLLKGMILGVLKCTEIIWEELCKSWVYEHEDVHLSLCSLDLTALQSACFPRSSLQVVQEDEDTSPQEAVVTVDEVLASLDEALEYVRSSMKHSPHRAALEQRFMLRIDMTYLLAFLTSPLHTSPSVLVPHVTASLAAIPACSTSSSNIVPSPALLAAFSPLSSLPLPTPQPFPAITFQPLVKCWTDLSCWLRDVQGSLEIWGQWETRREWRDVEVYWTFLGRREVYPYASSIHRTLLLTSPHLFGHHAPLQLATSFLATLTGLSPSLFETLKQVRDKEKTFQSPARKALGWADRLSGRLVELCEWRCGNRSRGRRRMVNGVETLSRLVEETPDALKTIISALPHPLPSSCSLISSAIATLLLSTILEALLAGFELELYEADEQSQIWWAASRVAGLAAQTYERLSQKRDVEGPGGKFVESKMHEMRVIEKMCLASMWAGFIPQKQAVKFMSPVLGSGSTPFHKAKFARRFQWVKGCLGNDKRAETLVDYELWTEQSSEIRALSTRAIAQSSAALFGEAIDGLTDFACLPLRERGASVTPQFQLRWIAAIRRTAFANKTALLEIVQDPNDPCGWRTRSADIQWDSSWFPIGKWAKIDESRIMNAAQ